MRSNSDQLRLLKHSGRKNSKVGGSPGLMVMGGDSCSKGREFESWHRIPTGWTFFRISICCKNCNVCYER